MMTSLLVCRHLLYLKKKPKNNEEPFDLSFSTIKKLMQKMTTNQEAYYYLLQFN